MSNIKVTQEQIDDLLEKANFDVKTIFDKCTVVSAQLPNGFILTESSACVDVENYNEELGFNICFERIRERLWELEGYFLQKSLQYKIPEKRNYTDLSFSQALGYLKQGKKILRSGWNGKDMYLKMQLPNKKSKMTLPYIYMKTAEGDLVPWLASQTDLLYSDWIVINNE